MIILFSFTLFASATLLFFVQPMVAKFLLPLYGGAPAVWNTCMVFFQAMLLVAYCYVHVSSVVLSSRMQAAVQMGLLLLPLASLPLSLNRSGIVVAEHNPASSLLLLLVGVVGLPFFVIATTAPMLQKWFAHTEHPSAQDPYFLYAASNMGSMVALLGYPILVEPYFPLASQTWVWSMGYGVLIVLIGCCALVLWRAPHAAQASSSAIPSRPGGAPATAGSELSWRQRLMWLALAAVPSSLMLGTTNYLTTDISPIPLLWVIPLALYLLTFILVFLQRPIVSHPLMVRLLPVLILPLTLSMILQLKQPLAILLPLHLLTFFVAAMICHGELARSRPSVARLTEFYLWLSLGGMVGGFFNALLAPVIFRTVLEYPLALVLACLLSPRLTVADDKRSERLLDLAVPAAIGLFIAGFMYVLEVTHWASGFIWLILIVGVAFAASFVMRKRPVRFGLTVGAIVFGSSLFFSGGHGQLLHLERSFFGVYRVIRGTQEKYNMFVHGRTMHGLQSLDPSRRQQPLSYFTRSSPIGQVFAVVSETTPGVPVGIIGLGIGSMACYASPDQSFTFYEIDPVVERIARNSHYFTYLQDCPGQRRVVLGDARLTLEKAPTGYYGLFILDAFTSDAIPVHLLTREAIGLYLSKLADKGILALHISNSYLNLRPVLAALARNAGLTALGQDDLKVSETEVEQGKSGSQWVIMARNREDLKKLLPDARWYELKETDGNSLWTDDFSNVLKTVRWK
jgi:hypothetical protein